MKKKVYIAGPMTGIPELNRPGFNHYAKLWSDAGWEVINPATFFGSEEQPDVYVCRKKCVEELIKCDAVAILPGTTNEKHKRSFARDEMWLAVLLRIRVFQADLYVTPEEAGV
jgi:hypothetical protein